MKRPTLFHDECAPCARLLPKLSVTSESTVVAPPDDVRRLRACGDDLRRCPDCGTVYHYSEESDPGEPMVPATASWTLVRFSAWRGERVVPGSVREGWAAHQRDLLRVVARDLAYTRMRYVVESLTDRWLDERRFDDVDAELLGGRDDVVAVETAADLLHLATEEHRVWCVREFAPSQRPAAKEFLSCEQGRHARGLVRSLGARLAAAGTTLQLDSTFGYREIEVWFAAFLALENAVFRGFPVSDAADGLLLRLRYPRTRVSESAADMLVRIARESPEARARLAAALAREPAGGPEAVERVRKALADG
ncbi:MAG: hypothetical protein IT460_06770 [Planctomycetes bacterium]|nr:hypothetical protein [Planctomycetota bacterium]